MKKNVVLSLSGGMDSSSLAIHYLAKGYNVIAISFDYGQKHKAEIEKAKSLVKFLKSKKCKIKHTVIQLKGLTSLLNSALTSKNIECPEGHYEEENMKLTVVPNRNKIFASIIQAIALSVSTKKKQKCEIAMGIHAGDFAIYPDCRQEFRDADEVAFRLGNWDNEFVSYSTPYLDFHKIDILRDGLLSCEKLNIDFNDVYSRTLTSYKPILIDGLWYSDYKSASSVERVEAFIGLEKQDPTLYADETGVVTWEKVVSEVSKVLNR